MTPIWAIELAKEFWRLAKTDEPFPRELRRPIARAVPVTLVFLPQLNLEQAREWLTRNGVSCPCDEADRGLRACLVARSGHGFVFVDGSDPPEEQRFSLAHELAHFLKHYWQPRQLARLRLGDQVCEVFDGLRAATTAERLDSLLSRVPVGHHVHLMHRGDHGVIADKSVAIAEAEADCLAYELLAPCEAVTRVIRERDTPALNCLADFLETHFGLPQAEAIAYAEQLNPAPSPPTFLIRELRSLK